MNEPLKDKTLQYEQDYIESGIKWDLNLGDVIFKKSDIRKAVRWLKAELNKNSEGNVLPLDKAIYLINESFYDALRNRKSIPAQTPENILENKKRAQEFLALLLSNDFPSLDKPDYNPAKTLYATKGNDLDR